MRNSYFTLAITQSLNKSKQPFNVKQKEKKNLLWSDPETVVYRSSIKFEE